MNQVQAAVKTSALAIWSLVLGILGLLCFGFLAGIPAIICGHMGRSKINESNGALGGGGLALAGLSLGYASIIIWTIVAILAAIAIPQFVTYRDRAHCAKAEMEASTAMVAVSCYIANKAPGTLPTLADLAEDTECTYVPTQDAVVEISGTVGQLQIQVIDAGDQCSRGDRYTISLPENVNDGWQQ